MLITVLEFNKYKERLAGEVKAYCQDITIPLNQRWDIFKIANIGDTNSCIVDFESLDELLGHEVSWYDDFYKDRYATIDMVDIVERLEENVFLIGTDDCDTEEEWLKAPKAYEEEVRYAIADVNKVKEEILATFTQSFLMDW
jgi:hypothetical protein